MFYFTDYAKTVDKDHDRIEIRECWTMDALLWAEHPKHRQMGQGQDACHDPS